MFKEGMKVRLTPLARRTKSWARHYEGILIVRRYGDSDELCVFRGRDAPSGSTGRHVSVRSENFQIAEVTYLGGE